MRPLAPGRCIRLYTLVTIPTDGLIPSYGREVNSYYGI